MFAIVWRESHAVTHGASAGDRGGRPRPHRGAARADHRVARRLRRLRTELRAVRARRSHLLPREHRRARTADLLLFRLVRSPATGRSTSTPNPSGRRWARLAATRLVLALLMLVARRVGHRRAALLATCVDEPSSSGGSALAYVLIAVVYLLVHSHCSRPRLHGSCCVHVITDLVALVAPRARRGRRAERPRRADDRVSGRRGRPVLTRICSVLRCDGHVAAAGGVRLGPDRRPRPRHGAVRPGRRDRRGLFPDRLAVNWLATRLAAQEALVMARGEDLQPARGHAAGDRRAPAGGASWSTPDGRVRTMNRAARADRSGSATRAWTDGPGGTAGSQRCAVRRWTVLCRPLPALAAVSTRWRPDEAELESRSRRVGPRGGPGPGAVCCAGRRGADS